jgi:hypothetical protein
MWQRLKAWFEAHLPLPAWQRRPKWHWSLLAIIGLLILFFRYPITSAAPQERFFRLEASQFTYSPGGAFRQSRRPGDHRAASYRRGAWFVHRRLQTGNHLRSRQTARLTFVADRQGSFRFRCTVTCGNLHPFMIGKLQVGQNELLWRGALLARLALIAGVLGSATR